MGYSPMSGVLREKKEGGPVRASVIIPTFYRDKYLDATLARIREQKAGDLEIIVIDDGAGNETTQRICLKHRADWYWTARTVTRWRIPGFAFNIGVQLAVADIIVLTEPEIWQVDDCMAPLIEAVEANRREIAVPRGRSLRGGGSWTTVADFNAPGRTLDTTRIGFLAAMEKRPYIRIGGYDEDFTGRGRDDLDLRGRLLAYGLRIRKLDCRCLHLYHPRHQAGHYQLPSNHPIYLAKRGTIYRNGTKPGGSDE